MLKCAGAAGIHLIKIEQPLSGLRHRHTLARTSFGPSTRQVRVRVATTDPLPAYGGTSKQSGLSTLIVGPSLYQ